MTNNYDTLIISDVNNIYAYLEFIRKCNKHNIRCYLGIHIQKEDIDMIIIADTTHKIAQIVNISNILNNNIADLSLINKTINQNLNDLNIVLRKLNDNYANIESIFSERKVYVDDVYIKNFKSFPFLNKIKISIVNCLNIKEEEEALKVLKCIKNNIKIQDLTKDNIFINSHIKVDTLLLKNMSKEGIRYTYSKIDLPKYNANLDSNEFLKVICIKRLKDLKINTSLYLNRLLHELKTIQSMNFADYFLIIWDVVRYCNKENIMLGPGRGSAVGCLVSFLLNITKIDPVKYNLIFERFLNIDRTTMPDIDIDVEDTKKNKIILYLRKKYCNHTVTNIITYNRFGIKSLLREMSKIYNIEIEQLKIILNNINTLNKLEKSKNSVHKDKNNLLVTIVNTALYLEGIPRNSSVHASGIIIFNNKQNNIPYTTVDTDNLIANVEKKYCDELGLLKIDFLSLRNLTLIKKAIVQIDCRIFYNNFNIFDKKTFILLSEAKTSGIFQLESLGIRKLLRKLQPKKIEDLALVLALYRPGPMKFIDSFLLRRSNKQQYSIKKALEPILSETYGIIIYQEQIMKIVKSMARLTFKEADNFRKAISSKNIELLSSQKKKFVSGCLQNGYSLSYIDEIFNLIEYFSSYGFNKSHALGYAHICYKMAYIKANYTSIFICTLINMSIPNYKKIQEYFFECISYKIKILPLDINRSNFEFMVENKNSIRFGFNILRGISRKSIDHILYVRTLGVFLGIEDFMNRIDCNIITLEDIKSLVFSYAFSNFSKNQKELITYFTQNYEVSRFGLSLFDITGKNYLRKYHDDFTIFERQKNEQNNLGLLWFSNLLYKYREKSSFTYSNNRKSYQCIFRILFIKRAYISRMSEIYCEHLSGRTYKFLATSEIINNYGNEFRNNFIDSICLMNIRYDKKIKNFVVYKVKLMEKY